MKKIYNKKIILLSLLCLVCVGSVFVFSTKINTEQTTQDVQIDIVQIKKSVADNKEQVDETFIKAEPKIGASYSIEVKKHSVTLKVGEYVGQIEIEEKDTVYQVMQKAMQNNQVTFDGREYLGLGFFVTQVGSLVNGNGKNLMYYVNDKEASVGVSSYVLSDGDSIEWKLK
jgi:hypothetical protein